MELLLQEQFKTYNRLMKLQKNFKANPSVPRGEITARIELLTKYYKKFCENNENIEKIFAKHNIDTTNKEYFELDLAFKCELLYVSMKGELLESQRTAGDIAIPSEPAAPEAVPKEEIQEAKEPKTVPSEDLPKLPEVEQFSGETVDWLDFRSEYLRVVHSRSDISGSQKFNILKSALPSSVFEVVEQIFTSRNETGYEEAWNLLEEKFCKRTLIAEYLQKIMKQPSASGLSKSIFRLLDQTIKYLNALKSLNVDIKNWDVLLVHILVQKVGERTKTEWQATYSYDDLPTLYDFLVFLNSKVQNKEELIEKIKNFACEADSSEFGLCVCCKRRHPLWQCEKFESLGIDARLNLLKNKTVCVRCLSTQHTYLECSKGYTCRICQNKDHHYLLHKNSKRSLP